MVEVMLQDGTLVSVLLANINAKSSAPATSAGTGEIIYRSDLSKVFVNTGTAGTPTWVEIGSGGGGFANPATVNLDMKTYKVTFSDGTNPADSEVYRDASGHLVLKGYAGIKLV